MRCGAYAVQCCAVQCSAVRRIWLPLPHDCRCMAATAWLLLHGCRCLCPAPRLRRCCPTNRVSGQRAHPTQPHFEHQGSRGAAQSGDAPAARKLPTTTRPQSRSSSSQREAGAAHTAPQAPLLPYHNCCGTPTACLPAADSGLPYCMPCLPACPPACRHRGDWSVLRGALWGAPPRVPLVRAPSAAGAATAAAGFCCCCCCWWLLVAAGGCCCCCWLVLLVLLQRTKHCRSAVAGGTGAASASACSSASFCHTPHQPA